MKITRVAAISMFLSATTIGTFVQCVLADCDNYCLTVQCYKDAGANDVWAYDGPGNSMFLIATGGFGGPLVPQGFNVGLYDQCPNLCKIVA